MTVFGGDDTVGPDGALYVADWSNPVINHGEVDFRDQRRDHTHGRIWRLTAKGRKLVEKPKLVDAPIEELVQQLKSPEAWTRDQAKLAPLDLGTIDPRGFLMRFAIAVAY